MGSFSKYFFIFWIFLFILFGYWQINDPDPEIWVTIYAAAALFCGLGVKGIHPRIPLTVAIVACIVGAIYFFPNSVKEWIGFEMEHKDLTMKTQESEEARETFGLLIVATVLTYSLYIGIRKNKEPNP